jgi:hypothetical protein
MSCTRLSEFTHVTVPPTASVVDEAVTPFAEMVSVTVLGAGVPPPPPPPPPPEGGEGFVGLEPPPHAMAVPAIAKTPIQTAVRSTLWNRLMSLDTRREPDRHDSRVPA